MPRFAPHHIHLMSHDAMHAGAFYETMFGAELVASKGANGLPRANLKLGDQVILISTVLPRVTQQGSGPHSCRRSSTSCRSGHSDSCRSC